MELRRQVRSQMEFGNEERGAMELRRQVRSKWSLGTRRGSNGVAPTSAFPNRVWERGGNPTETTSFLLRWPVVYLHHGESRIPRGDHSQGVYTAA